jgi:hypothetical protein
MGKKIKMAGQQNAPPTFFMMKAGDAYGQR